MHVGWKNKLKRLSLTETKLFFMPLILRKTNSWKCLVKQNGPRLFTWLQSTSKDLFTCIYDRVYYDDMSFFEPIWVHKPFLKCITYITWEQFNRFFSSLFKDFRRGTFVFRSNKFHTDDVNQARILSGTLINRPIALRGHVTNASFKQWVGILLIPKIDTAHKNYLTPEIWAETHLREIFYGTLIFNKVVWFALAAMLEGILLPSNMAAKTSFCLDLVKRLIVTLRCAVNVPTSTFQHSPWSLRAKFSSERVNSQFQKSHFGHVTSYELTHFKKMVQFWKTKSLLFCSRHDPLIVFWRKKSYNSHFHKNDVTWPRKWPIDLEIILFWTCIEW